MTDHLKTKAELIKELESLRQRKQEEEKLAASNQQLLAQVQELSRMAAVVKDSNDAITIQDLEGNITAWNAGAVKTYGYSEPEALKMNVADLVPEDYKGEALNFIVSLKKGELVESLETKRLTKAGKTLDIWMVVTKLVDEAGKLIGAATAERDITERKQAEETIIKQKHLLEKAQELGQIGTWELDLKNGKLYWTDESCRIFGVPPGTIVTYDIFVEKIHPDDREYVNKEWMESISGKPYDIEHRLLIDGAVIWVREKADVTFNKDGEAVSAVGFTQDITERKQAEHALMKNQALLAEAQEVAKLGGFSLDVKTMQQAWTEETFRIMEVETKGVAPKVPEGINFIASEYRPMADEAIQKAMAQGESYDQEWEIITAKGNRKSVRALGNPNFENGEVISVSGSIQDITDRKQAEQTLFRINHQLRSSIENMPNAYILWDKDQRILEWNKAAETIFGYSKSEMLGKNAADYIVPEPARHLVADVLEKLKLGEVANYSEKDNNIRKDGVVITCEWFNTPIADVDGNIVGILTLAQDITERLKADDDKLNFEKQILQTQKLESLGVLAGGIAHDFNNILMGILGYADLALSDLDPIDPAREFVQGINDSTRKAAGLVKQMLAYSGKGKFSLEPIDLNHLIDDTIQMLEISISKNAILKFNYSDSPIFLEGDPSQIRQIIMNLVINASDAVGKKSGVIAVTTGSMYCDSEYIESTGFRAQIAHTVKITEGMYTFVEVSDTGTGMSNDTLARIFEPFFTTKFTGRGLGLSAVLGIVRGHHGMVKIYSEEGKGTTFKVLFPLFEITDNSAIQEDLDTIEKEWRGNGTFLIADDEEAVRTVGKHMIKRLGFDVLTAEDGREAIEMFKKHQVDIVGVLLDLTMPHKDGAEVFREINNLNPGVKVILTSGYNEQDATQQFVGKGLAGFIQKPYVAKELVKKIIEVMDKT